MPRGLAWVLLLVLLAPTAAAFPAAGGELSISYALDDAPAAVAAGSLGLEGRATQGLLLGGSTTTRLEAIPLLHVLERAGGSARDTPVAGATLELVSGALLWTGRSALKLDLHAPYALGLALPQAPLPGGADAGAGYLLAGETITGSARWPGGDASLVPLDAVVTLRDARGVVVPGWDQRRVNEDATASADFDALQVVFASEGAYSARIGASFVAGGADASAALRMPVAPADEDRLREALTLLSEAGRGFVGGAAMNEAEQLQFLDQISGILNGAVLLVPGESAAAPRESRYGDAEFPVGPLTLARGEGVALSWEEGEMRVAGKPSVALGRDGFAVEEPLTIWLFPLVSVLLWVVALAALVWYFVRRPPEGRHQFTLRAGSFLLWLLVLVGVFYLWDRSFQETFGVGVVQTLSAGVTTETMTKAGVLLALELVPWGIAGLLFALPVRIALGVALRYLGRGKSFKGLATAGGLVSLAVFGPTYALWCFNLVWQRAAAGF